MEKRLQLQNEFCTLLNSENVYFQPPASVRMKYPCIVFSLGYPDTRHADNYVYKHTRRYDGQYIHSDPDDFLIETMLKTFPYFEFERRYVANDLYHDAFVIYY